MGFFDDAVDRAKRYSGRDYSGNSYPQQSTIVDPWTPPTEYIDPLADILDYHATQKFLQQKQKGEIAKNKAIAAEQNKKAAEEKIWRENPSAVYNWEQSLGDPDLLQQYEAEDLARLNQPVEYLPNIDREYKWKPNTGEATTTAPTVTTPNTATAPNSTPAPTQPNYLSYSDYFANKDPTFTKWYGDYGNNFKDPKAAVDWFRLNGSKPYTEQPGFFSQLGQGLLDNFTSNPLGFAGGLFNLYQGFKQAGYMKDYYNTQKDLYNTQKNIMLNNERRNQEQWNMLKRQRASSSL